jgi:hypothetical protein
MQFLRPEAADLITLVTPRTKGFGIRNAPLKRIYIHRNLSGYLPATQTGGLGRVCISLKTNALTVDEKVDFHSCNLSRRSTIQIGHRSAD